MELVHRLVCRVKGHVWRDGFGLDTYVIYGEVIPGWLYEADVCDRCGAKRRKHPRRTP